MPCLPLALQMKICQAKGPFQEVILLVMRLWQHQDSLVNRKGCPEIPKFESPDF